MLSLRIASPIPSTEMHAFIVRPAVDHDAAMSWSSPLSIGRPSDRTMPAIPHIRGLASPWRAGFPESSRTTTTNRSTD